MSVRQIYLIHGLIVAPYVWIINRLSDTLMYAFRLRDIWPWIQARFVTLYG